MSLVEKIIKIKALTPVPLEWYTMCVKEQKRQDDLKPEELVICVHGLTRNKADFAKLSEALLRNPARPKVWCLDVVGRGDSDRLQNTMHYNLSTYALGMQAVFGASSARTVDWIGSSMGGLIGMFMASATNSPLRSLVLNDIGPFVDASGVERLCKYVGKEGPWTAFEQVVEHFKSIYAGYGALSEEQWALLSRDSVDKVVDDEGNVSFVRRYDPAISDAFLKSLEDVDLFAVWKRIEIPVLLLAGEDSDILSVQTIQRMHDERHPNAPPLKVVSFPKIGHAPSLYEESQIQHIIDFLDQFSSSSSSSSSSSL